MSESRQLAFESIEPTVFFAWGGEGLEQGLDINVRNQGLRTDAEIDVRIGERRHMARIMVEPGSSTHRVYVPDVRHDCQAHFALRVTDQIEDRYEMAWQPGRHWEVHLVQRSHHDLGYTDLPSHVLREHDEFMAQVLRFCEQTADWPDEVQFRHVVEQTWSLLHFLRQASMPQVEAVMRLARQGRIEVTALLGNETSELCGHEEQMRLVYPAFELRRRYGIPITTAHLNDIPGVSWGLASVLAGAGVRYFAPMLPDYFSWGQRTVHPFWDEARVLERDMSGAFWWQGPDGQRVLFWYGQGIGHLWNEDVAIRDIEQRLTDLQRRGYPYDLLRAYVSGGMRDNAPPSLRFSMIAREWNHRWAYPKLIVSTNTRFFQSFEHLYGSNLPTLRGELPNTDYTVGATSTARETAINRVAHDALPAAEQLATWASLASNYTYPKAMLAEGYKANMMYDEHTWGMAHPVGPAQAACWIQKSQFAYKAAALAQDVFVKSANRLADGIGLADEGYHVVVFNPLSERRSDLVRAMAMPLSPCGRPMYWRYPPPGQSGEPVWVGGTAIGRNVIGLPSALLRQPFELIDLSTGESVPYQLINLTDPLAPRPWAAERYAMGSTDQVSAGVLNYGDGHVIELAFVAEELPPMGYKTYRLLPASTWPQFDALLQATPHGLENRFFALKLDEESGAVFSLTDKRTGRQWVDEQVAWGLNRVLSRSPRSAAVEAAGVSSIEVTQAGPVLVSVTIRGQAPGCPQRTQEIVIYDRLDRVDFSTRLLKDAAPFHELYVAFPFALDHPQFQYEGSNATVRPVKDQLPGSNTDAYAVQHWVSAQDAQGGLTWCSRDAPVVALGELWPGYVSQAHHGITPPGYGHPFLDKPDYARGHIYSYVMANNWRTNFSPTQVADVLFRYSVAFHDGAVDPVLSGQVGRQVAVPCQTVFLEGPSGGSLPVASGFCQLDQPNVVVRAIKRAEDGKGIVVRLAEVAGQDTDVMLQLPYLELGQVLYTNVVEEDQRVVAHERHQVRVHVPANGWATLRCLEV